MRTASLVIVGAGVIGASLAYHLARRGWREILVLDRSHGPGQGSTGRATGGFRAQYATPTNVRLSLLSRDKLRCFTEETGGSAGYLPAGYLWLASTASELEVLRAARRVQHQEGLTEAVEAGPEEIARLNPAVALDEVIGGAFCPSDGFINPHGIVEGYLTAAQRLGVS
jgi:sarcosine oxidase, subunit beta